MARWDDFSAADFNADLATAAERRRAARDARAGQSGLFHVPATVAARPAELAPELPGQLAMFGDEDQADELDGGRL